MQPGTIPSAGSHETCLVEVLAAYSHSAQLADLQRCVNARSTAAAVPTSLPASKRPWSLQDRLDERTRADLIDAYRSGATAASLATTHGLSLRSVKRPYPQAVVAFDLGESVGKDTPPCA